MDKNLVMIFLAIFRPQAFNSKKLKKMLNSIKLVEF